MRRGGCQWLVFELRWSIFRVCDWGGWSKDFDHLTIIRYLFSMNDDPREPREHYLNPDRPLAVICNHCGRRCWCF
ncbi:hypothetical protein BDZ97DRAFT_1825990 [Flammula alnicola]|nr:hypothetical protein BDZ97DRAFT_1825990 [Flammula alnicola]